jgi:hypothetical protein
MRETSMGKPSRGAVVLAGLAFGVGVGVAVGLATGRGEVGFHTGFFGAFLFGFALHKLVGGVDARAALQMGGRHAGFADDEHVVHHGLANHWKGLEAVGGKLFLSVQAGAARLRFRSHALNVQTHDESWPLADVVDVEGARSLGIVPNALVVTLRDGRRERFVVSGRQRWIDALRAHLGHGAKQNVTSSNDAV